LHIHLRFGANAPQETKSLAIRPGQDVLPVVDALAGGWIDESRRPTAERRARLEDEDAHSPLGESGCRTQPGKAAADDDDVIRQRSSAFIHKRSAMTAR